MQSTNLKKQQGLSLLPMLIVLLMAGAIGYFALKIVPVYIENWALKNMMEDLESSREVARATPGRIRNIVLKRIRINGVYTLKPKHIKITRKGNSHEVSLNYKVAKNLAGNMEVVMTFSESATIPISR